MRAAYLIVLAGTAALLALSRTQRGQEVAADVLEEVVVTAKKVSATVAQALAWSLPAAGQRFAQLFDAATVRYGLPPLLLARVAYQESRFRDDIIDGRVQSSAGAVGLMQLVPKYHPTVNALDPAQAITYAAQYLQQNFKKFGSWALALAAYNAGPGNVTKYGGIPPFPETQAYVAQIGRDVPGVLT